MTSQHLRTAFGSLGATLVEQLDQGAWIIDAQTGEVLYANDAAAKSLETTTQQLIGTPFLSLTVPEMSESTWTGIVSTVKPGKQRNFRVALQNFSERGDAGPVNLHMRAIRQQREHVDVESNVEGTARRDVLAVVTQLARQQEVDEFGGCEHEFDLTAGEHDTALSETVHELESEVASLLMGTNELFDGLSTAAKAGLAIANMSGTIIFVNPLFVDLIGLPEDQLLNRSLFDPPWQVFGRDKRSVEVAQTPGCVVLQTSAASKMDDTSYWGPAQYVDATGCTPVSASALPLHDRFGQQTGVALVLVDRSPVVDLRNEVNRLQFHDGLTGLPNRHWLTRHIDEVIRDLDTAVISKPEQHETTRRLGLLHINLDSFRALNSTFGSTIGDEILVQVSQRITSSLDPSVPVGRLSADEFLVLPMGVGSHTDVDVRLHRLAEELQRCIEAPLLVEDLELRLNATVGVSRWPSDGGDTRELMSAADRALTTARIDGRLGVHFYQSSDAIHTREGLELDRELQVATARRGLEVHYQPIIDLRTGRLAAAEALIRWNHPERGPIPPSVFIPTAEATGTISAISDHVLTSVSEDIAKWNVENLLPEGARIAVNISATEFAQRGFVDRMSATLRNAGVSPQQIELEITETLLMSDVESAARHLRDLDALGFLVALDDFGTGYSSLSYLHTLPLHTLKVDRTFVGDLQDGRSEMITRSILALAQSLGIISVGEGVETAEQRRFLRDAGCDLVQGFLFAPPLPRAAFERFLLDDQQADWTGPALVNAG